jgi:hypothetical protein
VCVLLALGACRHSEPAPQERHAAVVVVSGAKPEKAYSRPLRPLFAPACRALARATCDVRAEPCQERLFELAQCVSARSGARPPLRFVSEDEARQVLLQHRRQASSARTLLGQAVALLGLGAAEASGEPGGESAGAHAYYAPRERAVFFVAVAGANYAGEREVSILTHEYVHALQDARGALLAELNARDARSFDQELAAFSAHEGEATLHEDVVRAWLEQREPEARIVERFAARADASDEAIVRQRRPLEAAFATFPYTYGAHFALFETAEPTSTHELLASRHAWPRPADSRCADTLAPSHPRGTTDSLGAWLVQAFVLRLTRDLERARSVARRWRGDWIFVSTPAPAAAPSFTWQTCWDSAAAALEMRELVSQWQKKSSVRGVSLANTADRLTLTVSPEEEVGRLAE